MRVAPYFAVALVSLSLAACGPGHNKTASGTVVGAVAGGLIGNAVGKGKGQAYATALGVVLGGIVGNSIGQSLDEADRRAAQAAEYRALEHGQSGSATPWRNPDTGRHGTVVPGRPYTVQNQHCRNYTHTIYIDGRPETMTGKACRQPDGTWRSIG
ncbi:MAG: glycine zipper 2TM domain-containing protein [Hyphomicrobiales bacterium]|nr:glycine zipper 2TM domain-containing protein [Hyphomicrobiales bacterium]